jgi:hypothetical protein
MFVCHAYPRTFLEANMTPVASILLNQVKTEYIAMPGLTLTIGQASRLWQLDTGLSRLLLTTLVRERFLAQTPSGQFARLHVVHPRGQSRIDTLRRSAERIADGLLG